MKGIDSIQPAQASPPSMLALAWAWVAIGSQSLGGGPATLYLMRALLVDRHKWITPKSFLECWVISKASPGMHLVALSGLVGERIAGLRGIAVSVSTMVLPAALITVLFTAGLVEIEQQPLVQGIMRGIVPATGGIALAMAVYFGQTSVRKGRLAVADWLFVAVAALLVGVANASVLLILAASAVLGVIIARPTAEFPKAPSSAVQE